MDCGADSRFGAEDGVDTQPEIIKYRRSGTRFVSMRHRIAEWYHGLFHLAQVTINDRWVKRLRLIAFVAASSIATQIVLRSALGEVGLGSLLPSRVLTILVASAIWLVASQDAWLRLMTV